MKYIFFGTAVILTLLQPALSDCGCKEYFDPVCGTNDRDYPNICELHCDSMNQGGGDRIVLAYGGPCKCDCSWCPIRYEPVCGSDGRTYWNWCWLECYDGCNQGRDQPRISQISEGYCCLND